MRATNIKWVYSYWRPRWHGTRPFSFCLAFVAFCSTYLCCKITNSAAQTSIRFCVPGRWVQGSLSSHSVCRSDLSRLQTGMADGEKDCRYVRALSCAVYVAALSVTISHKCIYRCSDSVLFCQWWIIMTLSVILLQNILLTDFSEYS